MNARWVPLGVAILCALGLVSSCRFEPDLSRFEMCGEDNSCPSGYTCLTEVQRCLPDCGANCSPEFPPDASSDAGMNDGGTDAGLDAGTDAGPDAGTDAGPPLSWVTERLEPAIEAVFYSTELQAEGGTPPYEFRPTEPLPQGLTLDAGVLSGTISTEGTYPVKVEVLDSETPPASASAAYELRVRPELRVAGPKTLVDGYQGAFYTEKVSAIGGMPPYTFERVGGAFPSNLSFLSDGTVQGTPSAQTTYNFRARVTDSDSPPQMAEEQLSLKITGTPLLVTISNHAVPDGRRGTPYQYALRIAPSTTVTWSLKAGALPGGVGLNTSTGLLSGAPNAAGSFTFTLSVTDGLLNNAEETFTLVVH
jgi:hypothetical protein